MPFKKNEKWKQILEIKDQLNNLTLVSLLRFEGEFDGDVRDRKKRGRWERKQSTK